MALFDRFKKKENAPDPERQAFFDKVVSAFRDLGDDRDMQFDADAFAIVVKGEQGKIFLTSDFAVYQNSPEADRDKVINRFVKSQLHYQAMARNPQHYGRTTAPVDRGPVKPGDADVDDEESPEMLAELEEKIKRKRAALDIATQSSSLVEQIKEMNDKKKD